ncbi:SpoIIIAH-like family protein [Paenibacillus athensensis]|uniref:SpoIIIAH-like family protein n=1 Tax=Paenibacillus athensensis TaxID=1967502 RepID=A0A4Y8Q186_9BACL|nr:SpoIIIAH-like family protein [Paenibacillus athensensis]MCD1260682.1 SpoIIIAH-like family protein [Paenibacillus athensensis]
MNAKRQTIWLVSMLSLMVVLSAYYLFTEDVNKLDLASTEAVSNPQEVKIDMSQDAALTAGKDAASADAQAGAKTDVKATDAQAKDRQATDTQAADAPTTAKADSDAHAKADAKADAQVLSKVEAQMTSSSDYFTNAQMQRHEDLRKKTEELMTTITDPKQKPEAVAAANNELEQISGNQEKIERLEEVLSQDFDQAIITQDGNKWKITVQSDKLDKSQGVTIVDMVMKELGAAPENIKIQYVRP